MDISIVIVNYNGSEVLPECLNSVKKSIRDISYEIIVVDNASTDDSVNLIRSNYKEVNLIKNKENLGFAKANNIAFAQCNGRYVTILNNDTKAQNGAFYKMIAYLNDHPKVGAIGPKLLNTDMTVQRQGSLIGSKFWRSEHSKEVEFLAGTCVIFRKEVLDQIGPMDENLLIYNEDLDYCKRIRKLDWKIVYYPGSEVVHIGSYGSLKFNKKVFIEGFRGGLYFCKKYYGSIAYYIYRLLLPIGLILLGLIWFISFPFINKDKKGEYPNKLASLWEIFKIDLMGKIIPPKSL